MRIMKLLFLVYFVFWSCQEKQSQVENKKENPPEETGINGKTEAMKPEDTEIWEPKPPQLTIDENTGIPSDAIVLFNGTDFDQWISSKDSSEVKWILNKDGSMTVKDKTGDIQTKQNFGSAQIHLEWRSNPEIKGENQSRSNSGVFLQGKYEIQILDNNDNHTYVNGQVGSIYKQSIPLANASKPTGEWNSYDIIYHAPEFDENNKKIKPGTLTVLHNGVLIQDHVEIKGTTEYIGAPKNRPHGKGPLKLQDHGDNSGVSFRSIWLREI